MKSRRYDRSKLRYPSDLTDEEWAPTEPLIPPAKRGGNRWTVDARERTLDWLGRCRRLAKDWECSTARRSPSCVSAQSA